MKKYSKKEKMAFYNKKADEISNKYKFGDGYLSYGDVLFTNNWNKYRFTKSRIQTKKYDDDMYKLMYYHARASGDNHNESINFAKSYYKDMKYKKVVHVGKVIDYI